MSPFKSLNLALAFLLELALLVAIAYSAFQLHAATGVQWLVAVLVPIAVAVAWSRIAAPTAKRRLAPTPLVAFKLVLFTLGAAALYAAGQHPLALLFEIVTLANLGLSVLWDQNSEQDLTGHPFAD